MRTQKYILFNFLLMIVVLIFHGCGPSPEAALEKGFALYDLHKFDEAFPALTRAFEGGVDDPELVVRLAYCKIMVDNDPNGAIVLLQDNAINHPDYARTYYQLGFIASEYSLSEGQKNLRQAVGFTRKAIELDSTDWRFKDNIGMFFLKLGELDSAKHWFEKAYELNKEHPELNTRIKQVEEMIIEKARLDSTLKADTLNLEL